MISITQGKKPDLSIVIVSYKNASVLRLCLEALWKNVDSEIVAEVIVVDSESQEEIRDMVLNDYPKVRFFPFKENVGFAKALNFGMKKAKGRVILALNPDIVVREGAVKILFDYVSNNPRVGVAGPMLLNFNGSYQPSCFRFYTPATILYRRTFLGKLSFGKKALQDFIIHPKGDEPQPVEGWLMGSALMVRTDNLRKVGLMDERYFMYFEDVDWCRRFLKAGLRVVYVPQAKMFHYHGKVSASKGIWEIFMNKMTLVHLLSGLKYFAKFRGWKVDG